MKCPSESEVSVYYRQEDALNPQGSDDGNQEKNDWHLGRVLSTKLHLSEKWEWLKPITHSACLILSASANKIRKCHHCRKSLQEAFGMPDAWWADYSKQSNGYFGCGTGDDAFGITGLNSWAFFEVKRLYEDSSYKWWKINVFIRHIPSTNSTIVLLFDGDNLTKNIVTSLKATDKTNRNDPFWPYTAICHELAGLQTESVWAIRNYVRNIETTKHPEGNPKTDYRHLHDVARHAIHVTETLDVAIQTVLSIISQHDQLKTAEPSWSSIHGQLLYFQSLLAAQRSRSDSNEKRLQNELHLGFNMAAQYDSRVAVDISRATRMDSAAMKTIAALTLVFLPPTFISTIFSMSFFNFDQGRGWAVSGSFWVYWACALPITALTSVVYFFWQRNLDAKFLD